MPLVKLSKEADVICGRDAALKPRPGSYNSALETLPFVDAPPATNTFPLGSKLAAWAACAKDVGAVGCHVPVGASYKKAEEKMFLLSLPPAIKTFPVGNKVAVW
jgi:hypothetical protein